MSSPTAKKQILPLLLGGLLPVIAFTLIEEKYGVIPGIIAGMIFGVGEIIFELVKYKKVSTITWIGNALILLMGGISLVFADGIWFKLQPAIFEGFFASFLWMSLIMNKNFLLMIAEKQGQSIPEFLKKKFDGICFRLGLFFAIHTGLAIWAALAWSTTNWALLKGVGLMLSFIIYLLLEGFYLRTKLKKPDDEHSSSSGSRKT